jgi:pyruvate kinase
LSETNPLILTKILATVGPASANVPMLVRLIEAGVRAFRLNFSHGTFDEFEASLNSIREAAAHVKMPIGVLGDLSGPKIRLGQVETGSLALDVGDTVEFVAGDGESRHRRDRDATELTTNYAQLIDEVQPGHRVYIDDGAVRMLCIERADHATAPRLVCRVTHGGPISNRKGVNLPDTDLSLPSLTQWDRQCTEWAIGKGVDFLALSFVRKADDIRELKDLLRSLGRDNRTLRSHTRLPIVAKIEKPQAIGDLDGICQESDVIMVARGDLGVEMELAQVPVIQKRVIQAAHACGKPVIVATQMLQSMIESSTPTRAEVSDVANAILDGADAVMLSGETAVGAHPEATVRYMARTAVFAEAHAAELRAGSTRPPRNLQTSRYRTAALAHGVSVIVRDLGAKFVATWSELGGGALLLSQNRLSVPIIAISSNEAALRQMSLMFGVVGRHMPRPASPDEFLHQLDTLMLEHGWGQQGDAVVIAKGEPLGTPGVMNQVQIHYLGDVCRVAWHAKT